MDAIDLLRCEVAELEDENARLRAQLLQRDDVIASVREDVAELKAMLEAMRLDDAPGA